MDLNTIIRSEHAGTIQLVVKAEDLRKLLDGAIAWGMNTILERDEPRYYTREELRDLLHVSDPTLVNYRRKGLIPDPVTIEGRVLYDKAKVREAMRNVMLMKKLTRKK